MSNTAKTARAGRKAGQGSKWIRPEKRARIYARDGHRCLYCGASIAEDAGTVLTLDHVTACEFGGTNAHTNLVTACLSCNSSKRALPLRAFLMVLQDKGIDTTTVARDIRNATRRKLPR